MIPTVAIVGAGAAGLMAAIHAACPGLRVILLERTRDGGRKILISGGGRCNILPSQADLHRYQTSSSPALLKKLLRSWPLTRQRDFFEEMLQLPLVLEQESGKLFPAANRARVVRDRLVQEALDRGVEWRGETEVISLLRQGTRWLLELSRGEPLLAEAVILTTGGLSVPATGSDGFGLTVLSQLGHTIHPTYPALTPLTVSPPIHHSLAGITLPVLLSGRIGGEVRSLTGSFLFTHRGYSGPAVLNLSDLVARSRLPGALDQAELRVAWGGISAAEWEERLIHSATTLGSVVRGSLPHRLADYLIREAGLEPGQHLAQLRREQRRRISDLLGDYRLPWTGDEGYRKAEVTGGGVALSEINPRTMESRVVPRLFLAGELLDAFGPIGGYNFSWAWATGRQAGRGVAQALTDSAASP